LPLEHPKNEKHSLTREFLKVCHPIAARNMVLGAFADPTGLHDSAAKYKHKKAVAL
jgi:hypothetical protein